MLKLLLWILGNLIINKMQDNHIKSLEREKYFEKKENVKTERETRNRGATGANPQYIEDEDTNNLESILRDYNNQQ
jgi:hypothetical protein